MKNFMSKWGGWVCMGIVLAGLAWSPGAGGASMSQGISSETADKNSLYAQGKAAVERKDYAAAENLLRAALNRNPKDPDALNTLAFSERKQGRLNEAFEYYEKALALRSRFPEAREYLAEAHLQAALNEWRTLRKYGAEGKEETEELEKAFKEAMNQIEN